MSEQAKRMLITGTRKGIGRYLAEYYLRQGHHVVGCSRGESDLKAKQYHHYLVDVCEESKVTAMMSELAQRFGGIDVLINNAGVASMNHFLLTPISSVQRVLNTNIVGTFLFCREGVRLMMSGKGGRIVNLTSVATPLNLEGESVYAASKAAIESLTRVLAREAASMNVTVNAVGPTPVLTDLIRNVPQAKMDALLARQPLKRFARFEDIANVIDFFIQDQSEFVTGQVVYLGGV